MVVRWIVTKIDLKCIVFLFIFLFDLLVGDLEEDVSGKHYHKENNTYYL